MKIITETRKRREQSKPNLLQNWVGAFMIVRLVCLDVRQIHHEEHANSPRETGGFYVVSQPSGYRKQQYQ
ncbi:MAG TPA: hypothetical protein DCR93_08875 [Cytophagales bacterium]|nr:hypothetical protein [Cytophagales bacterium]